MAVQVMQHIETIIHEYQDSIVSPVMRLLRLLVRTEDSSVRKQMLRQKLLIGKNVAAAEAKGNSDAVPEPLATDSPQCMHIVVDAVKQWGGADVTVEALESTIADVLNQVCCYVNGLYEFHYISFLKSPPTNICRWLQ